MDEPGEWAEPWPYWKFGLKQNDLHDSLHIKYNTVSLAIQDPEAFHHDVYELSTRASSLSEFERLLEARKQLRLKELDSMLEDASFLIVGCPKLIGTEQWPLAVQLFRTKSFDSLVRYFASYLPDEHPWHHDSDSGINSGDSDAASSVSRVEYADYDGPILFDEPEDDAIFYTHEPSESFSMCDTAVDLNEDQPARSNTIHSVDSGVSVTDRKQCNCDSNSRSPTRFVLTTESEPNHATRRPCDPLPLLQDDEAGSSPEDPQTPSTHNDDPSGVLDVYGDVATTVLDDLDVSDYLPMSNVELDAMDTNASTPKAAAVLSPATPATPLFETKLSPLQTRSSSANRTHPHHAYHNHIAHSQQSRAIAAARQLRRRDASLEPERPRRAQGGRASRGRDASPDAARSRARARRRRPGI